MGEETKKIWDKLKKTDTDTNNCTPVFFRLNNEQDIASLSDLLTEKPHIKIYDTIQNQLRELVKSENPQITLTEEKANDLISRKLKGQSFATYGVWVYYPWNEKLVHILDEEEFAFLRTSRNKYKITDEEEKTLSKKIVGVVGLSVGQSVSVTMAMERTFGELRIADFDDLEITNLNRLRTGLYNMGLLKTVQVARDIAEVDPYLKVTIYSDGLTNENIDDFFTKGGKLDLVIDECDGLDMKIVMRHKAKSLGIPILMEASDRGTVDVERFDLEPDRPILHGFIDHLDHTKIGSLTNDEKIPYIMPMLGIETISKRLKASMAEIKQTINTWPQLASAVTLGGALCADVTRRILLNQYKSSGRYFVDIEELIGDTPKQMEGVYEVEDYAYPALTTEQMVAATDGLPAPTFKPTPEELNILAQAGADAPSAANNQPWKFLTKEGALYLFHDKQQSYSWTDSEDFIAQIALGTAAENIIIKARSMQLDPEMTLFPKGASSALVAAFRFSRSNTEPTDTLAASYIGARCTSRKKGNGSTITETEISNLRTQAELIPGIMLNLSTDRDIVRQFAAIESAAERVRFLHPQSHSEFFGKELRWNPGGKAHITEGLDIKTLELTAGEETGMQVASDPSVIALLNEWGTGRGFEKQIRENIESASAIGLITVPEYSPEAIVTGGRAIERLWLEATRHNLSLQPMSAPLFLYMKTKYGGTDKTNPYMLQEINELYRKLCILFPELHQRHGLFLFRLFKADAPTARSLRKNIEELLTAV